MMKKLLERVIQLSENLKTVHKRARREKKKGPFCEKHVTSRGKIIKFWFLIDIDDHKKFCKNVITV